MVACMPFFLTFALAAMLQCSWTVDGAGAGDNCTYSHECTSGARCAEGVCRCIENFVQVFWNCQKAVVPRMCTADTECGEGSQCVSHTCTCPTGYTKVDFECRADMGTACQSNSQCIDGAFCDGTCYCINNSLCGNDGVRVAPTTFGPLVFGAFAHWFLYVMG